MLRTWQARARIDGRTEDAVAHNIYVLHNSSLCTRYVLDTSVITQGRKRVESASFFILDTGEEIIPLWVQDREPRIILRTFSTSPQAEKWALPPGLVIHLKATLVTIDGRNI